MSAGVPLPIMIHYLLEHISYDPSPGYAAITVPVLILAPSFDDEFLKSSYRSLNQTMTGEWIKYYFGESWNNARNANPLFQFREIPGTRYFMWKDNPAAVYKAILDFTPR